MGLFNNIRKLHRNAIIFIYPIVYDLLALSLGLYLMGFNGQTMFSSKLILEMGFPSVSHISNIPLLANQVYFFNGPVDITVFTGIVVVSLIVIGAFLQGGYIHSLYAIGKNGKYSSVEFVKYGKKNWLQFILLGVIMYFLKISLTAFLVIFFSTIGGFVALIALLVLRIVFIYLEFTIVLDKLPIPEALKKSRHYFAKSFLPTSITVVIMYIISLSLSIILHKIWSPIFVIAMILFYAYIMTLIQMVFMTILSRARKEKNNSLA